MSFPFFDAPEREPSRFVAYAGNTIDTQSERRADDAVERALAEEGTRVLVIRSGRLCLAQSSSGLDPLFTGPGAATIAAKLEHAVLLGRGSSGAVLAAPGSLDPEQLPDTVKSIDFRSIHVQGLLDASGLGALAQGAALLAWHQNHRFCGRCGHKTEARAGGYKRICVSCKAEHFPRTDPVAIMLAVTRTHCLLGRSPHFPPGMYSCLAGFIEPGETIENAVRRETMEEAGIRIGRVRYHASQPWPFPYSLMIGCYGEALSEEIAADKAELEDCRWFSREETHEILAGTHAQVRVPPQGAIAAHLIRAWADA